MSDDNREPTKEELAQRVDQLERTVQKMLPDRRQALRLGGTALAGGLLGAGATGGASAGNSQVGTIGSGSSPVDIEAEDISASAITDSTGTAILGESVASGSVTLSSGAATVDTGVLESTTATFYVALGPDTDDSEVAASIDANSGGNYEVHIDELNTSVGNPTVRYDIVRVR